MDLRAKLVTVLSSLRGYIASPSDIVLKTGLPRYEVLGVLHALEALDLVSIVHSRSNYKLYTLSETGERVLDALLSGMSLKDLLAPENQGREAEAPRTASSAGETAETSA